MEITSNSLQDLINKRAKSKAFTFVDSLISQIKASGLQTVKGVTVENGDFKRNLSDIFYLDRSNPLNPFTMLYEQKLKEFIESETSDFVKKVEDLHNQADTLLNIADNLNY
jgi:purine-nucleoside phosphorylase